MPFETITSSGGASATWAFVIIVAVVTITSIATLWVLRRINWL
jgi:zinc transporter